MEISKILKKVRRLQHSRQCVNPSALIKQGQRLRLNKCDAEEESNRSKVWLICRSFSVRAYASVCVFDKQRGDVRVGFVEKEKQLYAERKTKLDTWQ